MIVLMSSVYSWKASVEYPVCSITLARSAEREQLEMSGKWRGGWAGVGCLIVAPESAGGITNGVHKIFIPCRSRYSWNSYMFA